MIDRREFLQRSAFAGATVLLAKKMTNGSTAEIDLENATVASLQAAMNGGQATARDIAQAYLTRIADIDKRLNSIIELNPDALAIAVQPLGQRGFDAGAEALSQRPLTERPARPSTSSPRRTAARSASPPSWTRAAS